MSELSSDARDLVAQARKQGSELLGPSAEQRAQLREKLAPLWAAEVVQPRAASSLRWKLGSLVIVAGLGLLGWLYTQSTSWPLKAAGAALSPSAVSDQGSQSTRERSPSATAADGETGTALMNSDGMAARVSNGQLPQSTSSASTRGASEPCPRGSSLRAGVCAQADASHLAGSLDAPLVAAASGRAKRAATSMSETSPAPPRKLAPPPSAIAATPKQASTVAPAKAAKEDLPGGRALDAVPAKVAKHPSEKDMLAGVGLDAVRAKDAKAPEEDLLAGLDVELNADETAKNGRRVQPTRKGAPARLPLKAAEKRTPERAVQTDANPGPPSIDGELELLGAAQIALQKQRPSRALSLLQEHAFRFPTGAMVEERMAMQALALCAMQRRHAAQTVLSNLEARGSQSQLLPRVRSQCGL